MVLSVHSLWSCTERSRGYVTFLGEGRRRGAVGGGRGGGGMGQE